MVNTHTKGASLTPRSPIAYMPVVGIEPTTYNCVTVSLYPLSYTDSWELRSYYFQLENNRYHLWITYGCYSALVTVSLILTWVTA